MIFSFDERLSDSPFVERIWRARSERARYASMLLQQGVSILDTVDLAGYADQAHLTRSLRHFIGKTPAGIIHKSEPEQMSHLFKTTTFS